MKTIQNHPFDLILARDAKWPLKSDGRRFRALAFDAEADKPIVGLMMHPDGSEYVACFCEDGTENRKHNNHDIFLSADYSDPEVRAAVQRAHVLGKQVVQSNPGGWVQCDEPYWNWYHHGNGYMLAQHVPVPVANPMPAWSMPVAPAGPGWHRSDFTESDLPPVTDGGLPWRPLLKDERYIANVDWIDMSLNGRVWEPVNHVGVVTGHTKLRTRRPIPSAPKLRAWNKQDDVPGPACWIRRKSDRHNCVAMIVFMDDSGIHAGNEGSICYINIVWHEVSACEYSTDRKTWQPCEVAE